MFSLRPSQCRLNELVHASSMLRQQYRTSPAGQLEYLGFGGWEATERGRHYQWLVALRLELRRRHREVVRAGVVDFNDRVRVLNGELLLVAAVGA